MRIFQIVVRKLLAVAVLAGGGALLVVRFSELYGAALEYLPASRLLRIGGGCVLVIMALLALVPLKRPKRSKNTISFDGPHGSVTIQLDSVESTLARVVSKMPEVKKISVRLEPSEDSHKARVCAYVWMYKGAESAGAREIASRISNYLADMSINILGVEELTSVDLVVLGITVDAAAMRARGLEVQAKDEEALAAPESDVEPPAEPEPAPAAEAEKAEADQPGAESEDTSLRALGGLGGDDAAADGAADIAETNTETEEEKPDALT